jgi:ankyrin repeat protein
MLVALLGLGGFIGFRLWYTMHIAGLFNAVGAGDVARVEKLLNNGMSANQEDIASAQTILMYAAQFGRAEIVQVLLKHGADPNRRYKGRRQGEFFEGRTALMYAAEASANIPAPVKMSGGDQPSVLKLLIEAGANVNVQDAMGQSALSLAVERAQSGAAEFLIEHGANPNVKNLFGEPLLIVVIETSQFRAALLMIEKNADVNATDRSPSGTRSTNSRFGRPPLRSVSGETPLMTAARMGNAEVATALLRRGAKLEAMDGRGSNIWAYATNAEMARLLGRKEEKPK